MLCRRVSDDLSAYYGCCFSADSQCCEGGSVGEEGVVTDFEIPDADVPDNDADTHERGEGR